MCEVCLCVCLCSHENCVFVVCVHGNGPWHVQMSKDASLPCQSSPSTLFETETLPLHTTVCPEALLRVSCLHLLAPCRITGTTEALAAVSSCPQGLGDQSSGHLACKCFNRSAYLRSDISVDFWCCFLLYLL